MEPKDGHSVISLSNGIPCDISVWMGDKDSGPRYALPPETFMTLPELEYPELTNMTVETLGNCTFQGGPLLREWKGEVKIMSGKYQTIAINLAQDRTISLEALPFEDDFVKSKDGNARMRFVFLEDPSTVLRGTKQLPGSHGTIYVRATNGNEKLTKSFELQSTGDGNVLSTDTEEIDETT